VCADAARLHLLSGERAAALAAICRLVAAADLCVRGHEIAVNRSCISERTDGPSVSHKRRAAGGLICGISCPFAQRPASRYAAWGWRIGHFPVDFPNLLLPDPADVPICALTHYYAFGTMLRRK